MREADITLPLGIVLRRQPGISRWAQWVWRVAGVLPGAGPASWKLLRREGEAEEYHAATVALKLYRADAEAYAAELQTESPAVYVVLSEVPAAAGAGEDGRSDGPARGLDVLLATVSPFEAQDYADSGEEIIEQVPMPAALRELVAAFVQEHFRPERFRKRRRDKVDLDRVEDGIGDARIRQMSDVYRAPSRQRRRAGR